MTTEGAIADSLPRFRKARDLSQEELAEAAAVSVDTVARIEQGRRTATRPVTLRRLATALDVDVSALLNQPRVATHHYDLDITSLRRAISASDQIPGLHADFAEPVEIRQPDDITADVHQSWRAYVEGRHGELLDNLPTILLDARRLIQATTNDQKAQTYRVLSTAYRLAGGWRVAQVSMIWRRQRQGVHSTPHGSRTHRNLRQQCRCGI